MSDFHYIANLLSCLAEALDEKQLKRSDIYEEDEHNLFRKQAVNEIDRYRRMDEWAASWHNIYSTTALECISRLSAIRVMQPSLADYMQYTRPGNNASLRVEACACLVSLNAMKIDAVTKYIISTAATDPSPYIRRAVIEVIGLGIGQLAIGEDRENLEEQATTSLVIEQEAPTEAAHAASTRRKNIPAALHALRDDLADNSAFKDAFWEAVIASSLPFHELSALVNLIATCFEPEETKVVKFKYPRYWRIKHYNGDGVFTFAKDGRAITRSIPKHPWPIPPKAEAPPPSQLPKISLGRPPTAPRPSPSPSQNRPSPSPAPPKRQPSSQSLHTVGAVNGARPPSQSPVRVKDDPAPAPVQRKSATPQPRKSHVIRLKIRSDILQRLTWNGTQPPTPGIRVLGASDGSNGEFGIHMNSNPQTAVGSAISSPPPSWGFGALQAQHDVEDGRNGTHVIAPEQSVQKEESASMAPSLKEEKVPAKIVSLPPRPISTSSSTSALSNAPSAGSGPSNLKRPRSRSGTPQQPVEQPPTKKLTLKLKFGPRPEASS